MPVVSVTYGTTVTETSIQPLMDNLQSITYQTFEQDPVKYHNYEEVRVSVTASPVWYSPYLVTGNLSRPRGLAR